MPYRATAELKGELRMVGSQTMAHLVTLWGEGFRKFHPKVTLLVDCLYQLVLNRTPNAVEVLHWSNRLRQLGNNRVALTREFLVAGRQQG